MPAQVVIFGKWHALVFSVPRDGRARTCRANCQHHGVLVCAVGRRESHLLFSGFQEIRIYRTSADDVSKFILIYYLVG